MIAPTGLFRPLQLPQYALGPLQLQFVPFASIVFTTESADNNLPNVPGNPALGTTYVIGILIF